MSQIHKKIGIDVGALFLKAVQIDEQGRLVNNYYKRHFGKPLALLPELLKTMAVEEGFAAGVTGVHAGPVAALLGQKPLDQTMCQIAGGCRAETGVRYIIDVGGASSTLIELNAKGQFQGFASNSLCAAGTGSFLDEQAARLGISYEAAKGFASIDNPPTVATRCSVFAKSDLIHRQQEGYGPVEMWSGLCRGMTKTLLGTLLNGRPINGKTILIGGVAQNAEVVRWLKKACPDCITVPEQPHLVACVGAALNAAVVAEPLRSILTGDSEATFKAEQIHRYAWPLSFEKSHYPSFATQESWADEQGTEVRVHADIRHSTLNIYLGLDIGSTSTKAVLMDSEQRVVADVYRKTLGDPIGATKLLFGAIRGLAERQGATMKILGAGTTGSGRKIVGHLIGADAIVNEISAHVAGAHKTDPGIDTIFEIGGQDSKYMHLVDGHIRDSNMNYVCAAGTGSFVEEQAGKLGFKIGEAGQAVLGVQPPRATDRCTVFMEQDMVKLQQNGANPQDLFAAVMVSVTKNYLNKVVGNRCFSRKKIFFQGATARNPALVAAFERLLGVEIVVSPYCHVMGAFGVALLVQELRRGTEQPSSFRGLDLEKRRVVLRKEKCELCNNDCVLTFADIEGEAKSPSWGYLCGREPEEGRVRVNRQDRYLRRRDRLWREAGGGTAVPANAPVIGIPQALGVYTYLPLWQKFFNELGYAVELSGQTTGEIRELGTRLAGADFCFPAKVFIGHAAWLSQKEGVDFVFAPQVSHAGDDLAVTASVSCPYVQASPAYTRSAFMLNGIDHMQILAPVVDLRLPDRELTKRLSKTLQKSLGVTLRQVREAWGMARQAQADFESRCHDEGAVALTEAQAKKERLLLLVGRPYNCFDKGVNLGIPQKISEYGHTLLPLDFVKPNLSRLGEKYRNVYWANGQKILAALDLVRDSAFLNAVYLTNFSCGPDSFLLTYAEEIMGNKPFLALELDEHGSDTGYLTRLEAFFDVLAKPCPHPKPRPIFAPSPKDFRDCTLWIPNMHPYGTDFMAAALRCQGYDARMLPLETPDTYELGRARTRGSECLPTAITIGRLLKTLREQAPSKKKQAFFMPTAQGPCRFGQYASLHRQILDREGFSDVSILSPTSFNGYQGLDEEIRRTIWKAMLAGDALQKAVCKVRPYEKHGGETDRVALSCAAEIAQVIEAGGDIPAVIKRSMKRLFVIPVNGSVKRPLVGVVGEIYVRNNTFANEDLIRSIEQQGGEAWMTPISEWLLFTNCPQNIADHHAYRFSANTIKSFIKWRWLYHWEHKIFQAAAPYLDDRHEPPVTDVLKEGQAWFSSNIGGEAILTVGRAVKFGHQGAHLVVNVAPFCCMPGTVTTALFRQISAEQKLPIVNLFYDGTGGQNKRLAVYLENALKGAA